MEKQNPYLCPLSSFKDGPKEEIFPKIDLSFALVLMLLVVFFAADCPFVSYSLFARETTE